MITGPSVPVGVTAKFNEQDDGSYKIAQSTGGSWSIKSYGVEFDIQFVNKPKPSLNINYSASSTLSSNEPYVYPNIFNGLNIQ